MVHGSRVTTDGHRTTRKLAGERVTARRNELGFRTQKALADAAGVSRDRINKLENGERISLNLMSRVENTLQWEPGSLDRLFDGGEPVVKTASSDSAVLTEAARVDVRKASTEELAALFMDMAKDHSDAEILDVMARVMKLRAQDASTRDAG